MDFRATNRAAWDKNVEKGNRWTIPVGPEAIAAARRGTWEILLTATRPVPRAWFPSLADADVLCLASGGGQQGPILAAAGAKVTVFDNSPKQLAQDRLVALREGLALDLVEGDMADLSLFADDSFDLIVHPVSNCFVPNVRAVWNEAFRVLRRGGILLAGFDNPVAFVFDADLAKEGILRAKHALPYSDLLCLSAEEHERLFGKDAPLEWSHTLEDQIAGQLEAGFVLTGFYEDLIPDDPASAFFPGLIATRAVKL